jgi:hypothetical protein
MSIYCGNNRRNRNLINGLLDIGTRSKCFKKGFGVGFNQPIDPDYLGEYEPIYIDNIYCGDNQNDIPINSRMGTLPQCLQKGVAIGKLQKARNNNIDGGEGDIDDSYHFILKITLILFIDIIFILSIIYFKPKFFLKNNTREFNSKKITSIIIGITILLIILLFVIFKNII